VAFKTPLHSALKHVLQRKGMKHGEQEKSGFSQQNKAIRNAVQRPESMGWLPPPAPTPRI
jgi:hypothetical protein